MTAYSEHVVSLNDLPDEVIQHILLFVPATSLPHVSLTCKRLSQISNEPTIWRAHCQADFIYWDESHNIRQKLAGGLSSTDWKSLYLRRRRTHHETTELLDSILSSQTGRIAKFQAVAEKGYDTKDTLLQHMRAPADAEDVLARR